MFIPRIFRQQDQRKCIELIKHYPFASMIVQTEQGVDVHHLPLVLQSDGEQLKLLGHIAKANPLWKQVEEQAPVLITFQGPNAYISPNWYPSKQRDGKAVPTWNYIAVHVRGQVTFSHRGDSKRAMLTALTEQLEAGQAQPWQLTDAPEAYVTKMLSAIVGFEIKVQSIEGKWKISQNQSFENQQGVVNGLGDVGQQVTSMLDHRQQAQTMQTLVEQLLTSQE
ncbi:FMN-binding negative transcriptional regulator [Motilimonas pumila]|uniref:FMN-binding negative transcriptional regulator n=1 Tax=Motilimonas pumila TaxID=2303987 RepID=A0A418YFK2_9GAMM|nr:FMN-binding negative transcriptional regulator [Motilimonas pumila]RJG47919.1 FMN-binding negative transcriptional regulator [Motilimonas pumila]